MSSSTWSRGFPVMPSSSLDLHFLPRLSTALVVIIIRGDTVILPLTHSLSRQHRSRCLSKSPCPLSAMGSIRRPDPQYVHALVSERSIAEPRHLKALYLGTGVSGIVANTKFPPKCPSLRAYYNLRQECPCEWNMVCTSLANPGLTLGSNAFPRFENRHAGCPCGL